MEIVGIDSDKVLQISKKKKEDEWVQKFRLDSYEKFEKLGMPEFGPEVDLDFSKIIYYKTSASDEEIKNNVIRFPKLCMIDEMYENIKPKNYGNDFSSLLSPVLWIIPR